MTTPNHYHTIVIDLDGTLLSPRGNVTTASVEALQAARDAGLTIIVATGRAMVESLRPIKAINHEGLVVAAGGSLVCDAGTGRTVSRSAMPHDLVIDATEALLGADHKVLLLKDPDVAGYDYLAVGPADLDPASEWWFQTLPLRVRFVEHLEEDPHPEETVRLGAVASETELAPLADVMQRELGDRAFLQHWGAVTASTVMDSPTHLLEVFNPNVDKWTAVQAWCEEKGRPREGVVAIGDGLNDVQIVREAGLGIAMGNADDRVTAVADRITEANTEDGVAGAIRRVLDGEW